jgi:hypothetical protein
MLILIFGFDIDIDIVYRIPNIDIDRYLYVLIWKIDIDNDIEY